VFVLLFHLACPLVLHDEKGSERAEPTRTICSWRLSLGTGALKSEQLTVAWEPLLSAVNPSVSGETAATTSNCRRFVGIGR
jgi:hypothetical protein